MFNQDIYDTMLDNDETWYVYAPGDAVLLSDCSLIDN